MIGIGIFFMKLVELTGAFVYTVKFMETGLIKVKDSLLHLQVKSAGTIRTLPWACSNTAKWWLYGAPSVTKLCF